MVARLLLPLDMEAGREGEREAEGSIENSAVNQALRLLRCVMLLDGRLFNVHFNTCAFAWQTRDLQISLDLSCCFQTGGCLLYTRAEDHSNKVNRKKLFLLFCCCWLLSFQFWPWCYILKYAISPLSILFFCVISCACWGKPHCYYC